MPFFSTVNETATYREITETFSGYNRNLKTGEGEWYHTKNLTSDYYPVMSQRKKRGFVKQLENPQGMLAKDALAYIDDQRLFYNDMDVTSQLAGVNISPGKKQLVSMGAYLCIFPDGIYFNTEDYSDNGYMGEENTFNTAESEVTFNICKMNGDVIEVSYTGDKSVVPEKPASGSYWLDTTNPEQHSLRVFNGSTEQWETVGTTYIKISANGIGTGFSRYDGVTISGATAPEGASDTVKKQIEALNNTVVLYEASENHLVVIGLLDASVVQNSGVLKIAREVPEMDFVIENGNRLWGCKYGVVEGETVNEIYCCALGDFKNWKRYLGVSTDAWAAGVGTDGQFTGAITHLGYPLFFKENCIHKVYPSANGAHQIITINARGVQNGSEDSLAIVNEVLYYKSSVDVCSFSGSLPASVSTALGVEHYKNARAGTCGDKYVLNMQDSNDEWHLFVLDTLKGIWLHEDDAQIKFFTQKDHDLYWIDEENGIWTMEGMEGTFEAGEIDWEAESGIIGFNYPDKKYLSRFNLRLELAKGSSMDFYIQYDSQPEWIHQGHIEGVDLRTFTLPIRPRRCDHLRMKIEGKGEFKLYSIAKILEIGSDY